MIMGRIGQVAWNKGKTKADFPQLGNSGVKKGNVAWNKGIPNTWSSGFQKGHISPTKGKKLYHLRGVNACHWQGGKTEESKRIRNSTEYRDWRLSVFKRDNYTCQACGIQGGMLHADHVLPFAFYPDLRFEILNGRTLCVPCHKRTDTYGSRAIKYGTNGVLQLT